VEQEWQVEGSVIVASGMAWDHDKNWPDYDLIHRSAMSTMEAMER
jgi:hypothetical protein